MTQMQKKFENSYGGYWDYNPDPLNPNIGDEIWKLSHTCITGKAVLLDIVHLYPL